jgi:hypothetical protein
VNIDTVDRMRLTRRELTLWAPRIVGLGLAFFLSLFALDAFSEARGIAGTIVAFAMGLLPAAIVLATVIIGWKRDGIASLVFAALTIFYAVTTVERPLWIVFIAGPLALVAGLFFLSWRLKLRQSLPQE